VRIVVADPPAFTPPYDRALAEALAREGHDVTLLTSRFRFGEVLRAEGYAVDESLYPLSSRFPGRSPLRLPLRALEHPVVQRRLSRASADVVHVQWLAWPRADVRLRLRGPSVFTAHDLLPRRTAARTDLWRRLLAKFDRVIVHSEHGRETLAALGMDARVIPHPVFRADVERSDDGATVLALGVIRAYKGLPDAVEATRIAGVKLLVAGDPAGVDVPAAPHVEARLGYLDEADVDRALAESSVAVFPYRPELDQSGALLRALGAGVPVVAYDVGGIAEPVRRFGAGVVVAAGDVDALADAVGTVLADPEPFRAGARRARDELTWADAARAHIRLYEEIA
jgi:glycosyltransferase involved in cell wall biosynthesis